MDAVFAITVGVVAYLVIDPVLNRLRLNLTSERGRDVRTTVRLFSFVVSALIAVYVLTQL